MESIKQIVRTLSLEKSYLQKTGEHLIESQRDITHHPRSLPQEALPRSARFEEARKRAMKESPEQFKLLQLVEAAKLWLDGKKLHIRKPRTLEAYQLYIRNLSRHLGECRLSELHIGHILEYQQSRRAEGASASYVNHETNTLAQILKRADLWDLVEKHYKPLPIGNWTPPKVMTPDEEARFFRAVHAIAISSPLPLLVDYFSNPSSAIVAIALDKSRTRSQAFCHCNLSFHLSGAPTATDA